MFECMDDCIHLKACRRIQAIGRRYRLRVPRYCDEDCTAYISGDSEGYITVEEALTYARSGASSIRSGYDEYDVYASVDIQGQTLKELVNQRISE